MATRASANTQLAQSKALITRLCQIYPPSELLIQATQLQPYESDALARVLTSKGFAEFLTIPAYEDL